MIERQPINFRYWLGDRVRSDHDEEGVVVAMSAQEARGGHRLTYSYRLQIDDPVWQDRRMAWVPEPALSPTDG
jgi:hypothetical protein